MLHRHTPLQLLSSQKSTSADPDPDPDPVTFTQFQAETAIQIQQRSRKTGDFQELNSHQGHPNRRDFRPKRVDF